MNFPDLQKLSGQHCWRADGVFATLHIMHFSEKSTTLEKAHKTQNGQFYELEKNRKKTRQEMVQQNLRNDEK